MSTPVRTCIGCRRRADRSALLRVVAVTLESSTQVVVRPDPRGRLPGRGAWLHPVTTCVEQAVRRRAFGRALRLTGLYDLGELERFLGDEAERAQQTVGGPDQGRPNS